MSCWGFINTQAATGPQRAPLKMLATVRITQVHVAAPSPTLRTDPIWSTRLAHLALAMPNLPALPPRDKHGPPLLPPGLSPGLPLDRWHCFDDSHVSPVSDMEALRSPAAYVLFYRRRREGDADPRVCGQLLADLEGQRAAAVEALRQVGLGGRVAGKEWRARGDTARG